MSTVRVFTDGDAIRRAWDAVFKSKDPFSYPFAPGVEASMVFYPTYGYCLEPPQYDAVVAAARAMGDEAFLLSIVECQEDWVARGIERGEHRLCGFPSHQEYQSIGLPLESSMYSPKGKWGVLFSHEDHALVGGSGQFIAAVKARYPRWGDDLANLVAIWENHRNGSWVAEVQSRITTG